MEQSDQKQGKDEGFSTLSSQALQQEVQTKKGLLYRYRVQKALGKLQQTHKPKQVKREIARMLTELSRRVGQASQGAVNE